MKTLSIFSIILGMAQICAAVMSLEKVVNVAQCNFLARVTIVGILCVGFGIIFLAQNLILGRIRK